jgi:hypothetical protein
MKSLFLIPLVLFTLSSCGQRRVRGTGANVTVTRDVPAFTAIEAAGSADVEVFPAATSRVEITGYKNLLPHYKSTVSGGILSLGFESDDDIRIKNSNIRVRVYGPGIERMDVAGSGNAIIHPGATTLLRSASLAGSGDITIRQSDAPSLALEIAGSGSINARKARAANVEAEIAGSGNIEVTASERLNVDIAGSGDVHYWGSPRVEKDVAGSGDVVQH